MGRRDKTDAPYISAQTPSKKRFGPMYLLAPNVVDAILARRLFSC